MEIAGVAGIEQAQPGELTFIANSRYHTLLAKTRASAVILGHSDGADAPCAVLRSDHPYLSFAQAVGLFREPALPTRGVHSLTAIAESPDLILLDMMMPHMDGLQTLQRLRADARTREIPVIFMTARAQRAEIESYLSAGAVGIITKPFDPMQLASEVRRIAEDAASAGR